jgi:DNA replication protein DnaC
MRKLTSQTFSNDERSEMQRREEEHKQRELNEIAKRIIEKANLPARHLANLEPEGDGWKKLLASLASKSGRGFIIGVTGARGTGKTLLSAFLARHEAKKKRSSKYQTAMGFFLDVKESFDGKLSEKTVIESYVKPKLLIIDEMQERGQTPWEDRLLTHLIDKRYGEMHDTLLISNQTKEEFTKSLGASIASRISETGGIAVCNWPSFRSAL